MAAKGREDDILAAMEAISMAGDAYIPYDELLLKCTQCAGGISGAQFHEDIAMLLQDGVLHREGERIYLPNIWQAEASAADNLFEMLLHNKIRAVMALPHRPCASLLLDPMQQEAVAMALTHRISIVLGGAGTGKSTLIQAIVENWSSKTSDFILCAPTGKAAQNLRERLQLPAYTVHGALGKLPGESFLSDEKWEGISLIIVDEASMLTLEMLAGLLCKATRHCHMVLLGDPNQLLSLGAGNVLQDLQRIGVPGICLNKPYRQRNAEKALYHNIAHFPNIASIDDLHFDDSFLLWVAPEERIPEIICDEAAKMYRSGESVQVLSHFNKATDYSVAALNDGLKKMVNQDGRQNLILQYGGMTYYHGDRVMITSNDSQRGCYNGDIGRLQIHSDGPCGKTGFTVVMQHGRTATWTDASALKGITLAYALTVHKSQGSQYDTVFLPVSESLPNMMHRNLLYTAISRARERVILVGERQGLAKAMLRRPRGRRSGLLERIGMKLCERAS